MAFGDSVKTVLTTSLPEGVLATTVQFAYSIAVIFTFPLQNFPALEITCRTLKGMFHVSKRSSLWARRNFMSSVLVVLLSIVAVCTMESLDKVVSLMGSLLGCPIAFVFPPLIHSRLMGEARQLSRPRLWANRITAGLGLIAMLVASAITLWTW